MITEGLTLYPFQEDSVLRMKDMPHVLLFDTMGLGKTIQVINHVEQEQLFPCLILCPRSLKWNWHAEIEKWTGERPWVGDSCEDIVEYYFEPEDSGKFYRGWYILHHDALATIERDPVREVITKIPWKCVAIDEAHRFRNPDTIRTEFLMKMKGLKFIFMTGSPIVNSTMDMWYMLSMMDIFPDKNEFQQNYTYGYATRWGWKIMGSKNKENLLEILAPYYIHRTKEQVLKELPPIITTELKLHMPPDQRRVYDNYEEALCIMLDTGEKLSSTVALSALTRLRQINLDPNILGRSSDSSKTKAVLELLEADEKEKWVIFTTSKKYTYFLAEKIPDSVTITGDDQGKIGPKIMKFRDNPDCKVLIGTMKTMGEGLNLQNASNVIICDRWWNQATIDQAINRLHRPGQDKSVNAYILENEKSIDDLLKQKCAEKEGQSGEILVQEDIMRRIYEARRGRALAYGAGVF